MDRTIMGHPIDLFDSISEAVIIHHRVFADLLACTKTKQATTVHLLRFEIFTMVASCKFESGDSLYSVLLTYGRVYCTYTMLECVECARAKHVQRTAVMTSPKLQATTTIAPKS
jgi:hypothetical protein